MAKYKSRDNYLGLYTTLIALEERRESTTVDDLVIRTGYKRGSLGAYIRNRLRNKFLFPDAEGSYIVRGVSRVSHESFAHHMSQKSDETSSRSNLLLHSLKERSLQAYLLALATYNNPSIPYRIESFCILVCNAWELLLKARIIEESGKEETIFRKDGRTISLTRAASMIFPKRNNPIRRNIEKLNDLRDQAVHLLIPDIQYTLSRLFQASVLDFLHCVSEFRFPNPHNEHLPGLLSIVSPGNDSGEKAIAVKYGKRTSEAVKRFLADTTKQESQINSNSFIMPIGCRVVLTKKASEGDIAVRITKGGSEAALIEVPKDHNRTHPYIASGAVTHINEKLEAAKAGHRFTMHSFLGALVTEKIRTQNDNKYYHRIEKPEAHKYSDELVDLLVRKATTNGEYVKKCHERNTFYNQQRK